MSVDGEDEPQDGTGGEPEAVLPSPQVPPQREGGSGGPIAQRPASDGDLIGRMRSGDDSAYEELFRRHADSVRRYARSCCRDAHTADDLTAEVFARTLQAVRGGAGPEYAVRAYLLTTVRRVAAAWTKTAKREQLVDDFAVFASQAAGITEAADDAGSFGAGLDAGAEVRAMHQAEQTMAMQAFRSLPERWQAVLWHTTVEKESPSQVAPLFGLTPNATAVLASRAREGLKQAYLQAHVSSALTDGGDCARYADRLGAYARGGLRIRAERGLREHLEQCAKCRLAAGEIMDVNAGIPALLPVAVIGWFAAGYSAKAAGLMVGGAAGAGAAAAAGGTSTGGAAAGGAAAEGLGAPAKAGIAAALAVTVAAGAVFALAGDESEPEPRARARAAGTPRPPAAEPVNPQKPPPSAEPVPAAPAAPESEASRAKPPQPPKPTPPAPTPVRPKPVPPGPVSPKPSPKPTPKPPTPPASPVPYQVNRLQYSVLGDRTAPEIRLDRSSWLWQRWGLRVADKQYAHGVSTHAMSSVTIDLNRDCTSYDAWAGVDDMTLGLGSVRFSVYGDGTRLWQSPVIRGGDRAVPVHVGIGGRTSIRLVVEPHTPFGSVALADWAESVISCR
ncbi:sigma-70 family RNA polymerase sigma factor [Streptomyces sp. NPDC051219]|uniref:sigma-70 family RNA polymerase sigma factor n=1 Tax=Streptomyces sp. NPDC051219 TaxID=3155283 RepID=UPI003427D54B